MKEKVNIYQGSNSNLTIMYVIENGKIFLTDYKTNLEIDSDKIEIRIPNIIDGYELFGIKESFFENSTELPPLNIYNPYDISMEIATSLPPNTIESIEIPKNITSISENYFKFFPMLKKIEINKDNSVFGIQKGLFINKVTGAVHSNLYTIFNQYPTEEIYYCINAHIQKTANIKKQEPIAQSQDDLTNNSEVLEIPYGKKSICEFEFAGRKDIKSIIIPSSVTRIMDYAFENCENLEYITLPNSVISVGNSAFKGCKNLSEVVLSKSLQKISKDMFFRCFSLKTIELPESITEIEDWAFFDCKNLKTISIPSSVSSFGEMIFCNCENLQFVTLPNNLKKVPNGMFLNCNSLTSIDIPPSVTILGGGCFYQCASLKKVILPSSLHTIGDFSLYETGISDIEIPSSVLTIRQGVFAGCLDLCSVIIPDSVLSLGNFAFEGCANLKKVLFGKNIKYVGYEPFYNCELLSSEDYTPVQ